MDSSNAVKEVANPNNARKEKSNQPIICSPVPDLVTNVPTTASTATTPTGASTNNTDASPVQPPSIKPTPSPSVVVKTATPTTQPIPVPNTPRATSLPSAASEASVKNRSRDEKSRKKDDKSVDHVLRALNSLNTTEEKLAAMCKKYADIFDEHRKLQLLHKQTEKRCSMLQREKEQLQVEHSKAILTRSRLENLCRELQRQNKAIKDESLLKIREEEEKRKEVSAKFQTTMNEITSLMQQNNDKNMKLRDDNIDMTTKLKNICEQYEIRQQQVERISKQMQLEQQLADAKLSKLKMEMAAEKEALLREKQQLLMELQLYQQRCTEYQTTEVNLRNQISMYNDKYDEFQKALARSNDVFGGFKGEMDKMSKKINKLEKETSSWKQRWERSHTALLEMGADKQKSEQELAVVSRQLATLQNLCRTLQTERSSLLAKLKTFQGQSHQCGGHEPLEKDVCVKQPPQQHVCDPPLNHVTGTDHYAQDIMAKAAAEATVTPSPLPDVVGVTNTCALDVNSALCPRLDNITLESSVPVLAESASVETPQPNVPVTQQLSAEPAVETPAVVNGGAEPVVETPAVVNGEAHTNGLSPSDQDKEQPSLDSPQTSPKSPSLKGSPAKSAENGKKAKESMKKKKK